MEHSAEGHGCQQLSCHYFPASFEGDRKDVNTNSFLFSFVASRGRKAASICAKDGGTVRDSHRAGGAGKVAFRAVRSLWRFTVAMAAAEVGSLA